MLATIIVIKSKINGRTIPLVLAGRKNEGKGNDKPVEPNSQESWQKLDGQTTVDGDRLQENLLKSVSCWFCHAHVTLLENVSTRSGLCSCWMVSCQNEDYLSRTVHFSNHKFFGAFAVHSCNLLIDICMHTSPKISFPLFTQTLFPVFGISQAVSLEGMWIHIS